jgi:hypothetical protein
MTASAATIGARQLPALAFRQATIRHCAAATIAAAAITS